MGLVKVSDLVIDELVKNGVDTIFGVTGGAVVHLFDSAQKHPDMTPVFLNHEQAASFAVEAYAKYKKGLGAGIFTTGPGATNALTGLAAAWLDSIPCIFLSGQVREDQTIKGRKLRQVGTQEIDIISMVKSITKYAVTVYNITEVRYHIQKAIFLSTRGRAGPVWIDIPVNFSWTSLEESNLSIFSAEKEFPNSNTPQLGQNNKYSTLLDSLMSAERPIILVGNGVRLSNAERQVLSFIEQTKIPFLTTWNICDFTQSNHPLNIGRPGIAGQRGANLAIQNCDFLLCLGSHLNSSITGTLHKAFAREAKIAVINIDKDELDNISVHVEYKIQADIKAFLSELSFSLKNTDKTSKGQHKWLDLCKKYQAQNFIALDYKDQIKWVNSYYFKHLISSLSKEGDSFVIDGGGTVVYSAFQSCQLKAQQRLILSTGLCSMGSGLGEAIGVAFANPGYTVYLFCGDGSFPFNMQELAVIKKHNLPIKIFVFNNQGYVSIRTTQADFLEGNYVGSSPQSGLCLPNIKKVASAFGLVYCSLNNHTGLESDLVNIIKNSGPIICEIFVSPEQEIVPRQGFIKNTDGTFRPKPLEDMYPYLERDLYKELAIITNFEPLKNSTKGQEINLLKKYPKSNRPFEERGIRKLSGNGYISINTDRNNQDTLFEQLLLQKAREFGQVYFDGDRLFGYGGYYYDPKFWSEVASDIISHYNLKSGNKVLDVGCAKGFLLHDLKKHIPKLEVHGLDFSQYAINNSIKDIRPFLKIGSAVELPYPDNEFDLVLSINTLSELKDSDCRAALREINRVSKKHSFITLNTWNSESERQAFQKWNLTAISNHSKHDWKKILYEEQCMSDYYWFTIE